MAFCLGLIRIIAIGPDVRIKLAEASHYICIAAVIPMPGSINTACKKLVFTAAITVTRMPAAVFNSKTINAFGIGCLIITKLIHIKAAVKITAAKFPADITAPDTVTLYFSISIIMQIAQTLT